MSGRPIEAVAADALAGRQLRYYDFAMAAFVAILICSNLIGAAKQATFHLPLVGDVIFGAGILFFPLGYVLGDVLTDKGEAVAREIGESARFVKLDVRDEGQPPVSWSTALAVAAVVGSGGTAAPALLGTAASALVKQGNNAPPTVSTKCHCAPA